MTSKLTALTGIELRKIIDTDLQPLFLAIDKNRQHLGTFLPWALELDTFEKYEKNFHERAKMVEKGEIKRYILCDNHNKILGMVGLKDIVEDRAEIGYWIGQEDTGKGYASYGVKLIENEAKKFGISTFIIRVNPINQASIKVALKNDYIITDKYPQYEEDGKLIEDIVLFKTYVA